MHMNNERAERYRLIVSAILNGVIAPQNWNRITEFDAGRNWKEHISNFVVNTVAAELIA